MEELWNDYIINPQRQLNIFGNPIKQFLFFSVSTELLLFYFKPDALFDKNGNPYPWYFFSEARNAVPVNVYVLGVFVGLVGILVF